MALYNLKKRTMLELSDDLANEIKEGIEIHVHEILPFYFCIIFLSNLSLTDKIVERLHNFSVEKSRKFIRIYKVKNTDFLQRELHNRATMRVQVLLLNSDFRRHIWKNYDSLTKNPSRWKNRLARNNQHHFIIEASDRIRILLLHY